MPLTIADDKVWFDESRKLEQICIRVAGLSSEGRHVLVLSHFETTVVSLAKLLREKGIKHERFLSLDPTELCSNASGKVWLGLAPAFQFANEVSSSREESAIEIIIAEHHPMHSRDKEVTDAAAKLTCYAQVVFYFSLDDPLMKYFGAESVKALFERLGIDKSECISHHLVNTAIQTAQEKIESKVGKDLPAHSAADWFRYNLPEKKEN